QERDDDGFSGPIDPYRHYSSNWDNGDDNITGKVVLVNTDNSSAADSRSEIYNMFNDTGGSGADDADPFDVSTGGAAFIIAGGDSNGNVLYMWYVVDANNNSTIDNSVNEIFLVGT